MRTTLIIVILLLVSYILFQKSNVTEIYDRDTVEVMIYKRDTISIEVTPEIRYVKKLQEIRIRDTVNKIDTIIKMYPFRADIDTIINNDTIKIGYNWPLNVFDLSVKYKLDSVATKTIINTPKDNTINYIVGGGVIGIILLLISVVK